MFKHGAEDRQFLSKLKRSDMIKYYLTIGFFLALLDATVAQKENKRISKFELHPIVIDTINEDVFVIHKRYATLYFKQPDIQEYTKNQNKFGLPNENSFIIITSMLRAKKKRIDLDDWFNEFSDEEKKLYFKFRINKGIDQIAMPEMWYLGSDLIRASKFMIKDNHTRKMIYHGLKMINQYGEFGTRSVQFKLPSEFYFWQQIYMFGD
jgi:hypothetical protein